MAFDKNKYISQYKKEHYSKLSVDLSKEQKQKLIDICNKEGITIKQFIVRIIELYEK